MSLQPLRIQQNQRDQTSPFEQVFGKNTFDIEDINVDSRVPQQPIGNTETRTGARQRVMACKTSTSRS